MTKTNEQEARATTAKDEAVLQAAARLFRDKGFAATTVRAIAQEAGMLPGSLHYRYPSKEALLIALMEHAVSRSLEAVVAAVADCEDPIERIRRGLRAHIRLLLSGDDAVFVLLYEWRALTGAARTAMIALRDRYEGFWDEMLRLSARQVALRPGTDIKLARLFGFGAINWAAQWYSPDGDHDPDAIADAFWSYMAFGVLDPRHHPAPTDSQ